MYQQIAKGKWNEFKGEMRKVWGDLTDSELEQTKGSVEAIGGLLEQKYGHLQAAATTSFDSLVDRFGDEAIVKAGAVTDSMRDPH